MFIRDLFSTKKFTVSFEVFPPRKDKPLESIYKTIEELKELNPDFISVTYGAGGSSKDRSIELASAIKNQFGIEVVSHLTCATSTEEEIKNVLNELRKNNIDNILALRGDIPKDFEIVENLPYKSAKDLINEISSRKDFCVSAAVYPEGHVDFRNIDKEINYIKEKVNSGTDALITQLFFDNNNFHIFREKLYKNNINIPVITGIMPVIDKKIVERITSLSGAFVPDKIRKIMDRYENSPEALIEAGIDYATEQISDLAANEVDGVHIYAMNKPSVVRKIVKNLEGICKVLNL